METILAIAGTLLYVIAAVVAVISLARAGERRESRAQLLLLGGTLLLLVLLVMRLTHVGGVPSFSLFDGLTSYVLALSGTYLLMNTLRRTRGISGLLFPFLVIILLCGLTSRGMKAGSPPPIQGVWLVFHVFIGYMAYAVFSLACVNAAAYLIQDHNLKHKHFGPVWARLPSLETLDHVMSRLVGLAFLLFTVTIVLGCLLVHQSGMGDKWMTDPKVAAVAATWILFAVLVHMRANADRHGRGVAILTVVGLAFVLFSFVGVHLVADSVHSFLQVRAVVGVP